jgi:hypothetical protein
MTPGLGWIRGFNGGAKMATLETSQHALQGLGFTGQVFDHFRFMLLNQGQEYLQLFGFLEGADIGK